MSLYNDRGLFETDKEMSLNAVSHKNTGQRADELISVSLSTLSPLVVKTTNLETQTRMNTEVKASHLLIYKGKVFIGSFGCRNDCMAVHFNCQKRRNSGFPPRRNRVSIKKRSLQGLVGLQAVEVCTVL